MENKKNGWNILCTIANMDLFSRYIIWGVRGARALNCLNLNWQLVELVGWGLKRPFWKLPHLICKNARLCTKLGSLHANLTPPTANTYTKIFYLQNYTIYFISKICRPIIKSDPAFTKIKSLQTLAASPIVRKGLRMKIHIGNVSQDTSVDLGWRPPIYLHWIFPVHQFEISSLINWIYSPSLKYQVNKI